MVQWAFDILGIAVTKDERQIKRAYAVLVKQYHPEEHPLEWARIHEAYQTAVEYAKTSETVFEEIPDIRVPEFPQWENTGIQNEEPQKNVEVTEDAGYGYMFQEEQLSWAEENAERSRQLQQRLERLAGLRGKKAEKEWRHYFEKEMLPDGGVEELCLLLHIVKRKELSEKALRVILEEIEKRKEIYTSREEYNCMRLAEEILDSSKERLAMCREVQKKTDTALRKYTLIAVTLFFLVFTLFRNAVNEEEKWEDGSVMLFAAANLNDKYDTLDYNTETLFVQEAETSDADGNEMVFYQVMTEGSWEVTACVIPSQEAEGESRYMMFDDIQSEEIKQAFEDTLNRRTGCKQGRLFWDSSMYHVFDGVEDGFFQTKYDKDFEAFIKRESEMRRDVPRSLTAYLAREPDAVNGICEYYVPGPLLQIEDRLYEDRPFEGEFLSEIVRISKELRQCAADYHIQIRGIALPDYLFEGTIEQAESGGADIEELRAKVYERGYVFGTYLPGDADDDYNK